MANFIDLDSTYRVFTTFSNPCQYVVVGEQVEAWSRAPRTTSATSSRPSSRMLEFSQSVKVLKLILPYTNTSYYVDKSGTQVNIHTGNLQRIELDVHTLNNDSNIINTIGSYLAKFKFTLFRDFIQNDINGTPKWIHFENRQMDQIMRFGRNEPITVNIAQEQGFTLVIPDLGQVPDPTLQTFIELKVTPYPLDAEYANHNIGLTQF